MLVIGASGGCGIAGLQLAKYLGASEVVAVSSRQNRELVLREGATDHVDYTTTNFADSCGIGAADHKKFDVVYDCASPYAGGESYKAAALTCLRAADPEKHGQYVALNGPAAMWLRWFTIGQEENENLFATDANTKDLDLLAKLVDSGWGFGAKRLNPVILKVFPLTSQADVVRCLCLIHVIHYYVLVIITVHIFSRSLLRHQNFTSY